MCPKSVLWVGKDAGCSCLCVCLHGAVPQHCLCAAAMTTLHSMSDHASSSKVRSNKRALQPWGSTSSTVRPTGFMLEEPHFSRGPPRTLGHPHTVPAAQANWVGSSAPGLPQRPPGWHCSPRLWCPLVLTLGVPRKERQTHAGKTWGRLVSGPTEDGRGKHQTLRSGQLLHPALVLT